MDEDWLASILDVSQLYEQRDWPVQHGVILHALHAVQRGFMSIIADSWHEFADTIYSPSTGRAVLRHSA